MRRLGFVPLLPDDLQAPIIVTFLTPADPNFSFQVFYDALREKGVRFTAAPEKQPWGGTLAHFQDPEGNELTLLG